MRAPPTTLEIVETWALREPTRTALREDDSTLDYGQLAGMLLQCAQHLRQLGVRHGQRVAVAGPGFGVQLVVLLACEALGAVTVSFQAEDDSDAEFLFTQVDWVFCGRPQPLPAGVRFGLLDADFVRLLAAPLDAPPQAWTPADLHQPQRISRTSGSTGASKFMLLLRAAQETWVRSPLDVTGYDRHTRLLMLGPLVINAVFGRSSGCLRQGGMLLVGHGRDIAQLAPTHLYGLPLHLERLLSQLPAGYVSPRPVVVGSGGGLASPDLRARVRAAFGADIANRYGSNEVHAICDELDAGGTGVLAAGVELKILDEAGRELPQGEDGIIAVRTAAMAEGYLARPGVTEAAFRDGWFFSGDVGAMVGRRRLRLLGRYDEIVNLGGIKVPAPQLEERLRAQPAIADAAVLAVHLQGGAVALGAVLVLQAGADGEAAMAQLQQALRLGPQADMQVLFVPALPRLQTGKTDRMALLRMLRG